jgi:hypothetical protein
MDNMLDILDLAVNPAPGSKVPEQVVVGAVV